jgi:tripartite-type tricarboxylate transporter receptor subunit TctC
MTCFHISKLGDQLMKLNQRIRISLSSAALLLTMAASAQNYPEHPLTIIVPFTPGGVSDITARPLAAAMSTNMGQPIVIENKGGAGGAIGMTAAAKSKPDGYSLMMALPSMITIPISDRISGRSPTFQINQFKPIARLTADPTVLAVRADSPWKTLADFVRDARAKPGTLSYSSSGLYGTTHVAMEILAYAANLKMVHVPYSGGGLQINALLGGHVDATMQTPGAIAGQIAGGKLRILTTLSKERVASLPDVPTATELGYKGEFYLWTGLFAPANTPEPVINRLRASAKEASNHTIFKSAMSGLNTPIQYLDSDDFAKFIGEDTKRLDTVLTSMGEIK